MGGKSMRNLGIVGSVIGAIILIFGLSKYNHAKTMHGTASWFGENESSRIWSTHMSNYKIFIIIGAIIFIVFIILTIAGIINSRSNNSILYEKKSNSVSTSEKMGELKKMLDNGFITEEEFEAKKKDIIDNM